MKKVLYFITQSEFGGAQRYVFDLANNLKGKYEIAVALGEQENSVKLARILTKNNIKYFIIPNLKRNISPLNDILALSEIIKLIKKYQPNIIHLNSSKISILGSLAAFLIRLFAVFAFHSQYSHSIRSIRIIYTVHGWVFNEPLPRWQKWFYLWAEKITARFKDKIICVSEYDRQTASRHKIAPENKLAAIHNGLAPISFYSREEARNKIPLTPFVKGGLLIGSIGNLYKTKGFKYFIQAADILVNQHHLSAAFIIIGEGGERKNLENLIERYNLKNNFILAGHIEEAAKLLSALDLYVCSSVKEGLPYSILEAMQAGLPIVSTNVGGTPEMIAGPSASSASSLQAGSGQATGLLAKSMDAKDLAEKIKKMIDNKNLAAELGRRAKERAATEFGLISMIKKTKEIYK